MVKHVKCQKDQNFRTKEVYYIFYVVRGDLVTITIYRFKYKFWIKMDIHDF
jgi:hypothetical protein